MHKDQEKTICTYLYNTVAFKWCMLSIFLDMVEDTLEVFMDVFSMVGNSFKSCLKYLSKILKRYVETNLILYWEKCHFMVK